MAFAIRISNITKGSTNAVMVSSPSSNQASTYIKKEVILKSGFDSHLYFLHFSEEVHQTPIHYQTVFQGRHHLNSLVRHVFTFVCTSSMSLYIMRLGRGCGFMPCLETDCRQQHHKQGYISCMPLLGSIPETKYLTSQICECTGMLTRFRQGPMNAEALCNMVQIKIDQLSSI